MHNIIDENGCVSPDYPLDVALKLLSQSKTDIPILDLRGFPCTKLPASICDLSGLKELYLDKNGLTVLPEEVGKIAELKILSLGRNGICALPTSLVERWATLEKLFLGENQITSLSFTEDDLWAFQHGSIGTNPLPEPIGRCWMIRQDALNMPEIMNNFVPPRIASNFAKLFADQFVHILCQASEPMIFEILFKDMRIQNDGQILWSEHFDRPWLKYVAVSLLPYITRGSIVDASLWRWNIHRLQIDELPEVPPTIQEFPKEIALL